jgi:molecular chaperone HscB
MKLCPYCEATLVTPLVCTACETILPFDEAPDPFKVFGLSPSWEVNSKELKRTLLSLSRHLHPDYFATADAETQALAEQASATLNEAYELLSCDVARADWLVGFLGGPSDSEERQLPQEFLMRVIEWNETLDDAREAAPDSPEHRATEALNETLRDERRTRIETVGALLTPLPASSAAELTELRRELNVVRYFDRTRRVLEGLRLKAALGGQS